MARRAGAVLAGLLASADARAANPAACADNCATAFNDIVGVAGNIVTAVEVCVPAASVDPAASRDFQMDCADQVLGMLTNIGGAGSKLSAATFNCGSVDSSCAQQILSGVEDFTSFGQDIIATVRDCPIGTTGSGIVCAGAVVSAVDDLVLSAKDIDSAVQRCAKAESFIAPSPVNESAGNETVGDELVDANPTAPRPGTVDELPELPERRRLAPREAEGRIDETLLPRAPFVV